MQKRGNKNNGKIRGRLKTKTTKKKEKKNHVWIGTCKVKRWTKGCNFKWTQKIKKREKKFYILQYIFFSFPITVCRSKHRVVRAKGGLKKKHTQGLLCVQVHIHINKKTHKRANTLVYTHMPRLKL